MPHNVVVIVLKPNRDVVRLGAVDLASGVGGGASHVWAEAATVMNM